MSPTPSLTWADPQREQAFRVWLDGIAAEQHLAPETVRLASADASFRRYLRVDRTDSHAPGSSRIIMDAPPHLEDCAPFVRVQALLAAAGLRVPQILAWDAAQGFMLLDDLGPATLMQGLDAEKPHEAQPWLRHASELLLDWQQASRPDMLPAYDTALLQRELDLFPTWYLGEHRQAALTDADRQMLQRTFETIIAHNLQAPSVFVHRDFMPRNLMLPYDAAQPLGVLDFQDAVYGPITYDIASLLRDAFISWEEDLIIDVTVRYWEKARKAGLVGARSANGWGEDFGEFYRAVEWMGLQRHLKVAGIFARLTLRDGKAKYLEDAPRFIRYIRSTASRYRELTPLLRLVDRIEGTQEAVGYAFGRV